MGKSEIAELRKFLPHKKHLNHSWKEIGYPITGEKVHDDFGRSISLSEDGDVVAVGAPFSDSHGKRRGSVRIFKNADGKWMQLGETIYGEDAGDRCGRSVSLSSDGMTVAVGSTYGSNTNGKRSGHARVFRLNDGRWVQVGNTMNGEVVGDYFGRSISLSADGATVAVGGPGNNNDNGEGSGHVRVFGHKKGEWHQIGGSILGETADDWFGQSVSISGDGSTIAAGAPSKNKIGSARIFKYHDNSGKWIQKGDSLQGHDQSGRFGKSVSLSADGEVVAIGAMLNDDENGTNSGQVLVFRHVKGKWAQVGEAINGRSSWSWLGWAVSLSSKGVVAVGAPWDEHRTGYAAVFKFV